MNKIGRASASDRMMGGILWGGGSTPADSRMQQKWGDGGHHGCGFQALDKGEQQVMCGSVESFEI